MSTSAPSQAECAFNPAEIFGMSREIFHHHTLCDSPETGFRQLGFCSVLRLRKRRLDYKKNLVRDNVGRHDMYANEMVSVIQCVTGVE